MDIKKQTLKPKNYLNFSFDVKKEESDGLLIEGLANAKTIDRMNEIVDPQGMNFDNFKKNPIILFDHGMDMTFGNLPIGRALSVEATDKGIKTKIKISNSSTEKIKAVRDLIQEGILQTFSIGFNPVVIEASKENPDINIIKEAELIEISIVPIPANQDSTFSILSNKKSQLRGLAKKWAVKQLKAYQKEDEKEEEKKVEKMNGDPLQIIKIIVSKELTDSVEGAELFATDRGFEPVQTEETENEYLVWLVDPETFTDEMKEMGYTFPLGNGVMAFGVAEMSKEEEPKEEDQEEMEEEEKSNKGLETQVDDNPFLHEARQTNVLLAMLNNAFSGLAKQLQGLTDLTLAVKESNEKEEDEEMKEIESEKDADSLDGKRQENDLEKIKNFQLSIRNTLDKLSA